MTRLFLVRHGETMWNVEGRLQGHADEPLNEHGHDQARHLAERLRDVSFSTAYSSDLARTRETMETIMKDYEQNSYESTHLLREISHGSWEGLTHDQLNERFPDTYPRRFMADDPTFAPPDGESLEAFFERVGTFAERLRAEHRDGDENVLIVSHGGVLRALLICLLDFPLTSLWQLHSSHGSVSIIELWPDGHPILELWNDTGHLDTRDG